MNVLTSSHMNGVVADFFIYAEPPPIEDLLRHHGNPSTEEVHFIIMTTNAFETASLRASGINHLTAVCLPFTVVICAQSLRSGGRDPMAARIMVLEFQWR